MSNKWQIDNETKYPPKDETDEQRLERIEKRVAWKLQLTKEDQHFYKLEMYPIKKELLESKKNANPNETPEEKKARLKELAKQKVKHLRSLPGMSGESREDLSTSNTPTTHIGKRGGRYTKDTTKDGRPYRRYF